MRTMSHNLALIAPRSSTEVAWLRQPGATKADQEPLNIVVVPFPYRIEANCFEARDVYADNGDSDGKGKKRANWGFFVVTQKWLKPPAAAPGGRGSVVDYVIALLEKAAEDVGDIHALVLPEAALDWETYCALVDGRAQHPSLELDFLISGSSGYRGLVNNYVLTTSFERTGGSVVPITSAQTKHHRWRLDTTQIRGYALASALDPARFWWEKMTVAARRVGLTVFRSGSTFAAMICEDWARSEPCHAALRAVGPNLVFVLLMDGPQLPQRWAAQYSTVLADDPGSSVLTLTSLGLVERSNVGRGARSSRTVALWKDSDSGMIPLECAKGVDALVLTLSGDHVDEATPDGRSNSNAINWRYHGHQNVTLRRHERAQWDWISE